MGKKNKQQSADNEASNGWTAPIWVAVITGIVSIVLALFNFPPFQRLFEPEPSFTPTLIPTGTALPTSTNTPEPTFTFSPTETFTPILPTETFTPVLPTLTPSVTFTFTPTQPIGMQAKLSANLTSGKIPLKVKFSAKESYFLDPAGTLLPCGACNFSWQVRDGSTVLYGPEKGNPTFEYTFGKRGTFYVSVYVCRSGSSTDCSGSVITIIAN